MVALDAYKITKKETIQIDIQEIRSLIKSVLSENSDLVFDSLMQDETTFKNGLDVIAKWRDFRDERIRNKVKIWKDSLLNPIEIDLDNSRTIFGMEDAPVTIVKYGDFECPYCEMSFHDLLILLHYRSDQVRFIYKHLPLDFHRNALFLAKIYEAGMLQGKQVGAEIYNIFFSNRDIVRDYDQNLIWSLLEDEGQDVVTLKESFQSPEIIEIVQSDINEATLLGFSGTPGFWINGILVSEYVPYFEFQAAIDLAMENNNDTSE